MARWRPEKFDVVVVLGAAQMPDGSPGPVIERRMAKAIELWHEGKAANLLVTGGCTISDIPEAETMAAIAREAGVREDAIVIENRATRTLENAVFSIKMIKGRGWETVLIVTDDFHMARATYCFRAMRMPVWPAAVRNRLSGKIFVAWCREIVGRLIYPRQVRAYLGRW